MTEKKDNAIVVITDINDAPQSSEATSVANKNLEIGGQKGPEPTRYGDWEKNGRVSDF